MHSSSRGLYVPFLLVLTWLPSATSEARLQPAEPAVDQVITRKIDVTGDGLKDRIVIHLKGANWRSPFQWSLRIYSKGKLVFSHDSDDAWLDRFFADRGYVDDGCDSYLKCKQEYYLHYLSDGLVVIDGFAQDGSAFDKANSGSIYAVAQQELTEKFKLFPSAASRVVGRIIEDARSRKFPVLSIPISPVQGEYPRMFVEEVGAFVTVYRW
jgi:hypothetical protein